MDVKIAVTRNMMTAVKERRENRGSPQSPWPLVQPLPNSVPNPTNAPDNMSLIRLVLAVSLVRSKGVLPTIPQSSRSEARRELVRTPNSTRNLARVGGSE